MSKLLARLTGGRPMKFVAYQFTDCVSGKPVNLYIDLFGRRWLANHRWALFRVESELGHLAALLGTRPIFAERTAQLREDFLG